MAQAAVNRRVLNVLQVVLLLLVTVTFADTDSCRKFCNKHRPDGSYAGYNITCAEVSSRNGTDISSCKKECESCSSLCSNEHFHCPRMEEAFLTAYSDSYDSDKRSSEAAVGLIILTIIICCPICICGCVIWAATSNSTPNYYRTQAYGQVVPAYQQQYYQPYQQQYYQPQVGVDGAYGTPAMGQPQNYSTTSPPAPPTN